MTGTSESFVYAGYEKDLESEIADAAEEKRVKHLPLPWFISGVLLFLLCMAAVALILTSEANGIYIERIKVLQSRVKELELQVPKEPALDLQK